MSDDEFRRVLIYGCDTLRTHVLWQAGHFTEIEEKLSFLRGVWPLQLSARTHRVVSRLVALAFDDETHFRELADAILPLIGRLDAQSPNLAFLGGKDDRIVASHPDIVLGLLAKILSDDIATWPYGIGQTLDRLLELMPTFAKDPRFIRLKCLWDRR